MREPRLRVLVFLAFFIGSTQSVTCPQNQYTAQTQKYKVEFENDATWKFSEFAAYTQAPMLDRASSMLTKEELFDFLDNSGQTTFPVVGADEWTTVIDYENGDSPSYVRWYQVGTAGGSGYKSMSSWKTYSEGGSTGITALETNYNWLGYNFRWQATTCDGGGVSCHAKVVTECESCSSGSTSPVGSTSSDACVCEANKYKSSPAIVHDFASAIGLTPTIAEFTAYTNSIGATTNFYATAVHGSPSPSGTFSVWAQDNTVGYIRFPLPSDFTHFNVSYSKPGGNPFDNDQYGWVYAFLCNELVTNAKASSSCTMLQVAGIGRMEYSGTYSPGQILHLEENTNSVIQVDMIVAVFVPVQCNSCPSGMLSPAGSMTLDACTCAVNTYKQSIPPGELVSFQPETHETYFDGNMYINLDYTTWNVATNGGFTFIAKAKSTQTTATGLQILNIGETAAPWRQFKIEQYTANSFYITYYDSNNGDCGWYGNTDLPLAVNTEHTIIFRYDKTNQIIEVKIDDSVHKTMSCTKGWDQTYKTFVGANRNSLGSKWIGHIFYAYGYDRFLDDTAVNSILEVAERGSQCKSCPSGMLSPAGSISSDACVCAANTYKETDIQAEWPSVSFAAYENEFSSGGSLDNYVFSLWNGVSAKLISGWTHTATYAHGFLRSGAGDSVLEVNGLVPGKEYLYATYNFHDPTHSTYAYSWGLNSFTLYVNDVQVASLSGQPTSSEPTYVGQVVADSSGKILFKFTHTNEHMHLSGLSVEAVCQECPAFTVSPAGSTTIDACVCQANTYAKPGDAVVEFNPADESFDGTNTGYDLGTTTLNIATAGFTVVTRVKFAAFQHWSSIFDFSDSNGDTANNNIRVNNVASTGKWSFDIREGGTVACQIYNQGTIELNTWYNIIARYKPGEGISLRANDAVFSTTCTTISDRVSTRTYIGQSFHSGLANFKGEIAGLYAYARFVDDEEAEAVLSTITNTLTLHTDTGSHSWTEAETYAASQGGRLPTLDELRAYETKTGYFATRNINEWIPVTNPGAPSGADYMMAYNGHGFSLGDSRWDKVQYEGDPISSSFGQQEWTGVGQYPVWFSSDLACVQCPSGSTSPAGSASDDSCICSADLYKSSGSCLACPASSTSPAGSTSDDSCVCNANLYKSSGSCLACPASSTSPAGSTSADSCECFANFYQSKPVHTFVDGGSVSAEEFNGNRLVASETVNLHDQPWTFIIKIKAGSGSAAASDYMKAFVVGRNCGSNDCIQVGWKSNKWEIYVSVAGSLKTGYPAAKTSTGNYDEIVVRVSATNGVRFRVNGVESTYTSSTSFSWTNKAQLVTVGGRYDSDSDNTVNSVNYLRGHVAGFYAYQRELSDDELTPVLSDVRENLVDNVVVSECSACPSGSMSPAGSISADSCECAADLYKHEGSCLACPPSMTSLPGSTSVNDCTSTCASGTYLFTIPEIEWQFRGGDSWGSLQQHEFVQAGVALGYQSRYLTKEEMTAWMSANGNSLPSTYQVWAYVSPGQSKTYGLWGIWTNAFHPWAGFEHDGTFAGSNDMPEGYFFRKNQPGTLCKTCSTGQVTANDGAIGVDACICAANSYATADEDMLTYTDSNFEVSSEQDLDENTVYYETTKNGFTLEFHHWSMKTVWGNGYALFSYEGVYNSESHNLAEVKITSLVPGAEYKINLFHYLQNGWQYVYWHEGEFMFSVNGGSLQRFDTVEMPSSGVPPPTTALTVAAKDDGTISLLFTRDMQIDAGGRFTSDCAVFNPPLRNCNAAGRHLVLSGLSIAPVCASCPGELTSTAGSSSKHDCGCPSNSYGPHGPLDGLVGMFGLNGNTDDEIGTASIKMYSGTATFVQDADRGQVLDNSATKMYIESTALSNALDQDAWSVSLWFKPPATWDKYIHIANRYDITTGANGERGGFSFGVLNTGKIILQRQREGGNYWINCQGSTIITANTWYHVVAISEPRNLKVYLNGNVGTAECDLTSSTDWAHTQLDLPPKIGIGLYCVDNDSMENDCYVHHTATNDGYRQDLRFYNRALTSDEIVELAARTGQEGNVCASCPSGLTSPAFSTSISACACADNQQTVAFKNDKLQAWYKLESDGLDSGPHEAHLQTRLSATANFVSGQYLSVSDDVSFLIPREKTGLIIPAGTTALTVSFWVKNWIDGYVMRWVPSNLFFWENLDASKDGEASIEGSTLKTLFTKSSQWTHMLFVFDQTQIVFYENGVFKDHSTAAKIPAGGFVQETDKDAGFFCNPYAASNAHDFRGDIKDIRFYLTAFTSAEAQALYAGVGNCVGETEQNTPVSTCCYKTWPE